MSRKICNHCGLSKDEEEFNWRFKSLGIWHPTCRECAHGHNKKYKVKESLEAVQEAIKILALGSDYRRYSRFLYLTPRVNLSVTGRYSTYPRYEGKLPSASI